MKLRQPFVWPEEQARQLRRAHRLEWATLFFMTTIILVMAFAMGSSQAMRAAWIEDILGLVPAAAFLIARRFERKPPDEHFPFGYYKVIPIAYLVAATTVVILALYLIYDSATALLTRDHPTIGPIEIFGHDIWMGWVMIAALAYSAVPPVILGRMKMPVAEAIHDKVLVADAAMQRADWMTALAGIGGIVGVGFGFWWADAVAALVISLDVLNDGRVHVVQALKDLADEVPMTPKRQAPDPITGDVCRAVEALPFVRRADVALRDEGHPVSGTIYISLAEGAEPASSAAEVSRVAEGAHWRMYDPDVVIVDEKAWWG
ncbi:cation transporter [Lutibaculum baratangense]|uniref:Cation efflux protein transmembrane domain-containing protein n=1 Tax=Lutibaculum baratangense AMV1 TaxID=631454 RepID=V4T7X5_9HYPH|nr:cation transporter [Lutibaculum baratangense]ESR22708.1 hypothetical protein N177_3845 [Lutibaculum baratangense AMV1]